MFHENKGNGDVIDQDVYDGEGNDADAVLAGADYFIDSVQVWLLRSTLLSGNLLLLYDGLALWPSDFLDIWHCVLPTKIYFSTPSTLHYMVCHADTVCNAWRGFV